MGEAAEATEASLKEIRSAVDLLHGRLAVIDTSQQSLVAQVNIMAAAIQDAAKTNAATARQLARMDERLEAQAQALEHFHDQPPSPEEDDPDPDVTAIAGTGTLKPAGVAWQGETAGASASQGALGRGTTRESARGSGTNNTATGGAGFLGGGGIGGAGGGGVGGASGGGVGGAGGGGYGGARGGKTSHGNDSANKHHLKMSFPRFDGDLPRIWKDKCLDYFKLFNVHPSLWLVSCTFHMDGNAALWLKSYRLRHEISTWPTLMSAVEEKFGADDHRRLHSNKKVL
jgi:hypothetical protein